jgi:hypothetical protein
MSCMEPEQPSQCSQKFATGPCLESDKSSSHPPNLLLYDSFNNIFSSMSNSLNRSLPFMLPAKILCEFFVAKVYVTCPAYLTKKDIIWDSRTTNNKKETK